MLRILVGLVKRIVPTHVVIVLLLPRLMTPERFVVLQSLPHQVAHSLPSRHTTTTLRYRRHFINLFFSLL